VRYAVEITEPAEQNIEEAHDWLRAQSPEAASRWIDGLLGTIESLETFPLRCPLAPESADHEEEIRQVLYGRYRILFVIRKQKVFVLHVRHTSRDRARTEDLYHG
jgi:plasmid stabilization system protein ParE